MPWTFGQQETIENVKGWVTLSVDHGSPGSHDGKLGLEPISWLMMVLMRLSIESGRFWKCVKTA